jgi:hypothetical protein
MMEFARRIVHLESRSVILHTMHRRRIRLDPLPPAAQFLVALHLEAWTR